MIPLQDQINCARREALARYRRYKRLIEAGKMTPVQADKEVRTMQAIVSTLESLRGEKK